MVSVLERFEEWFDDLVGEEEKSSSSQQPRFLQKAKEYKSKQRRGSQGGLLPNLSTQKLQKLEEQRVASIKQKQQNERKATYGYYRKMKQKQASTEVNRSERKVFEGERSKCGYSRFSYWSRTLSTPEKPSISQFEREREPGIYFLPFIALCIQRQALFYAKKTTMQAGNPQFNLVPTVVVSGDGADWSMGSSLTNGSSFATMHDPSHGCRSFLLGERRSTLRAGGTAMQVIRRALTGGGSAPAEGESSQAGLPIAVAKRGYRDSRLDEYRTCCQFLYTMPQVLHAVSQGPDAPVAVQKYVKAKGACPWKLRIHWNSAHGCTRAWLIKSRQRFSYATASDKRLPTGEVLDRASDLEVAYGQGDEWRLERQGAVALSKGATPAYRLGVDTSGPEHCTITAVQVHGWGGASQSVCELAEMLRKEAVARPIEMVCDAIQDDHDEWWISQVKAVRFEAPPGEKPLPSARLLPLGAFDRKLQALRQAAVQPKPRGRPKGEYDKGLVLQAIAERRLGGALPPRGEDALGEPKPANQRMRNQCAGDYCAPAAEGLPEEARHRVSFRLVLRDRAQKRAGEDSAREEEATVAGSLSKFLTLKERRERNKVVKVCDRCHEVYGKQNGAVQSATNRKHGREAKQRGQATEPACERLYRRFREAQLEREKAGLELMFAPSKEPLVRRKGQGRCGRGRGRNAEHASVLLLEVGDRVLHYRPRDGVERAGTIAGVSEGGEDVMAVKYRVQLDMGKCIQNVRAHRLIKVGTKVNATQASDWLIGTGGETEVGEQQDSSMSTTECPLGCGTMLEIPAANSGIPLTLAASHQVLRNHLADCIAAN